MVQTGVTTQWLLEGFRYELGSTLKSQTVNYYCGHIRRFLNWMESAGFPQEARLIDKRHIQAFFYYIVQEAETIMGGNGARRKVSRTEDSRWSYYRLNLGALSTLTICSRFLNTTGKLPEPLVKECWQRGTMLSSPYF